LLGFHKSCRMNVNFPLWEHSLELQHDFEHLETGRLGNMQTWIDPKTLEITWKQEFWIGSLKIFVPGSFSHNCKQSIFLRI
jgi:hypothetical protein